MPNSFSIWLWALVPLLFVELATSGLLTKANPKSEGEKNQTYRLPNNTYPEHYGLTVTTNVHTGEKSFQAEVVIDVVVVSDTDRIVLHSLELDIDTVTLRSTCTGKKFEQLAKEYDSERDFLILTRKAHQQFSKRCKYQLKIPYSGKLRDDKVGFYMIKYSDDNDIIERYIALTQFESTRARYAFPCYDEPAKRAKFTITINHSPKYTAISNMPVNEQASSPGKTVFLTTARLPTYILAFVVCDLEYSELIYNGLRQRVYSGPSGMRDHQFSLVNGMQFLNYFSEYYGIDYMLPKLDHVAVTQLKGGGMENWGVITYPEESVLLNVKSALTRSKIFVAFTVAHEVAHQWFGDYVTIQWWNNVWIKEGFATVFGYKAIENVYPEWDVWQDFHVTAYQRAMYADAVWYSRPMKVYVEKPSEIADMYGVDIAYYKSAAVLLMWQNALGETVFRRALQSFLKNNQYSAVAEEDLFAEIQKSVEADNLKLPAPISEIMGTWTHQGGYPILTVTRNYNNGSFTVKQEAFFQTETLKDNKTWYVPINFASGSEANFRDTTASHYLPNSREIKVDAQLAAGDWLVLNKRSEYYYRIKYDEDNYKLITQTLIERPFRIHPRNRAQLINDASLLSSSNRLNPEIVLEMLTYLKNEYQYAPWSAASNAISEFVQLWDFKDFKKFVTELVTPIYKRLGVDESLGEHHNDKNTRSIIIGMACGAGLRECLIETNKKLKAYVRQNTTLEPNIEMEISSYGLIEADDNEFNFFYQKFLQAPDEEKRIVYIYYLSFLQKERHITKYLSSSIDMSNSLPSNVRTTIFEWLCGRRETNSLACIKFLSENWNAYGNLKRDYGENPLDRGIRQLARRVLNKSLEEKLLALVAKVKNSKHVSNALESDVKKQIDENYQWLQKQGAPVLGWLSRYLSR